MTNPLAQLTEHGVAVWVDSIARDWLEKGELRRLRDDFSVVGVTSNPTIFQAAIGTGSFYDDQLAGLAEQDLPAQAIFERLALYDIRWAAYELRPLYQASGGRDGYVSYELPPDIAHDTEASTFHAARLFDLLSIPNALIKIPATKEGLPAIQASIAAGINVNVTLVFSVARYREVVEAYLAGLEERAAAGGDLGHVASVASFFVSRVDTLIDPILEDRVEEGGPDAALAEARLGTAAIDNAKLAYQAWLELFAGPRWEALAAKGARPQRCLWASTSTKNPNYRDVLYSEELIGPDTVNTMPLSTVEAFGDHGIVRGDTLLEGLDRANRLWSDLIRVGIDEEEVGEQLEEEGVEKFAASYLKVLDTVEDKRTQIIERDAAAMSS
ncbi:MAG TPA: transaldolase [Actinomycetes bacterium]|nr:transaldolase [Actinomycetes bacterium]